ncbi:MAG: phage holin family protein [Bacteroidales bacterium]|nr:phage holin family protein [Bacteroidales bacterium]MCM1147540.1 phage holin family protein [Bacteroidales bacterium]MCM1206330.1 phage holin family protein [Bacillota bacterium]MCM1511242.1 phage holin family protein [Clostridium sp.]
MMDITSILVQYVDIPKIYMHMVLTFVCWLVLLIAVAVDMWDGIRTARAIGERISSNSLRKTVTKYTDYWRLLIFGALFDMLGCIFTWYQYPYVTLLITAGILTIEFRSMLEHSTKRKDHINEIPEIVNDIIHCVSHKDAEDIVRKIKGEEHSV